MTHAEKSGDDNRTTMIRVRVKPTEKIKLLEIAAEAGLSISDLIRKQTLKAKPVFPKPNPDREVMLRILAALGKIGSSINQIAKHANYQQRNREDIAISLDVINSAMQGVKTITHHLRNILDRAD